MVQFKSLLAPPPWRSLSSARYQTGVKCPSSDLEITLRIFVEANGCHIMSAMKISTFFVLVIFVIRGACDVSTENIPVKDITSLIVALHDKIADLESQVEELSKPDDRNAQKIIELEQTLALMEKKMSENSKAYQHRLQLQETTNIHLWRLIQSLRENETLIDQKCNDIEKRLAMELPRDMQDNVCEKLNQCSLNTRGSRAVGNGVQGVAFSVYLDHAIHNLGPNQILIFNQILLNEGHAYNKFTGVFSATVGGVYIFAWSVAARDDGTLSAPDIWTKLVVNGEHKVSAVAESTQIRDDEMGTNVAILRLDQGDAVWIAHHDLGNTRDIFSSDSLRVVTFSGALLFA
ncbi:hypothetical protein CHS0354_024849 [Potamilus streckersoni]|uniref:C1q domain-containing protein n=1 Tax=Potamilus streckersoni TaxID=2493646 RepID=A0AAE0RQS6_9BIVA|nr:hypothetical protein CHS0354_024849 [Potamilus streckersoni]